MILITLCAFEIQTLATKSESIYSNTLNVEDLINDKAKFELGADKYF